MRHASFFFSNSTFSASSSSSAAFSWRRSSSSSLELAAAAAAAPEEEAPPAAEETGPRDLGGGLMVRDQRVGPAGAPAAVERASVTVCYVGKLHASGSRFDHCSNPNKPFRFCVGAQEVVDGFDGAVRGMRVGGVRQVVVPPHLAYGDEGAPPKIPPRAYLEFTITLVGVELERAIGTVVMPGATAGAPSGRKKSGGGRDSGRGGGGGAKARGGRGRGGRPRKSMME